MVLSGCLAFVSAFVIACQAGVADEVVFEDRFEGALGDGWTWIRERGARWCVREGALEIRVVPGLADTVENALLRAAPDRGQGDFAIELKVTNLTQPVQQYEQAGLTWYHDGKPVFKLVKELVDGRMMIIPGRKPIESQTVELRLIVTADSYTAQYRAEGKGEFQTGAKGPLPSPGKDQISIQCYNGPPDQEHWIRFDDFRIVKLPVAASP
jgi:regulation of enolase protein 1 (concanavalin A-like superfamily)